MEAGQLITPTIKLVRLLGKGGMGEVWAAEHQALGTLVAVKLMSPKYADDNDSVLRFRQEAQSAARIKSPHVTSVFDYGLTEKNQPYIVMEMHEGQTLRDFMAKRHQKGGYLTLSEVVDLVGQTARALDAAHKLRVWHRDIKPDNLFVIDVAGKRFVKVVDFGLAKLADAGLAQTSTGKPMGTPLYMSPEQFNDTKSVDYRTDLWALGVVAYEMLTGTTPFAGNSFWELAFAVHKGAFQSIQKHRPELPKAVDAWMARVFSTDVDARFGSVMEMADALAAIQNEPLPVEKPIRPPNTKPPEAFAPTVPVVIDDKSRQAEGDETGQNIFDKLEREWPQFRVREPGEPEIEIVTNSQHGYFSLSLRNTSPRCIAFDDRGVSVFAAFATGDVLCIDLMTTRTRWWRRLIARPVSGCAGAGWFAIGDTDGNVQLLTQANGTLGSSLKTANAGGIRATVMIPARQTLATPERKRRIALWSLASGERLQVSEEHSGEILALAIDRTRGHWLSGSRDSVIRVWSKSLQPLHVLRGGGLGVRSLAVSPNGNYFAAGYTDGKIVLYDGRRWEIAKVLEGHADRVHSLVFLRDSNTLISGAADGNLCIWNVSTGKFKRVRPFERGHGESAVECVAVSPNDSYIASASAGGKVCVYRWPIDARLLVD
ncbi:MAG TPA: serine/threonine-protein kinase [Polyangium sp.]|nr:serine/threonine-protein kinase [Polyangium sp.]